MGVPTPAQARKLAERQARIDADDNAGLFRTAAERAEYIAETVEDILAEWDSYTDPESIYGLDVGLHDYR